MTVLQLSTVAAGLSLPAGVPAAGVAGAAVSVPAWEGSVVPVLVAGAVASNRAGQPTRVDTRTTRRSAAESLPQAASASAHAAANTGIRVFIVANLLRRMRRHDWAPDPYAA